MSTIKTYRASAAFVVLFFCWAIDILGAVEEYDYQGPEGIEVVVSIYDPSLVVYRGKPAPGQRNPDWITALSAKQFPASFSSFEEWMANFGHGAWEIRNVTEEQFSQIKKDESSWPFHEADTRLITHSIRIASRGIEYLFVADQYRGGELTPRNPDSIIKGITELYNDEGDWKPMMIDSPPLTIEIIGLDPHALVERIKAGEFDNLYDFTLHLQSFPEISSVSQSNVSEGTDTARDDSDSDPASLETAENDAAPERSSPESISNYLWWFIGCLLAVSLTFIAIRKLRR